MLGAFRKPGKQAPLPFHPELPAHARTSRSRNHPPRHRPELTGLRATGVVIRNGRLRHPIPPDLEATLAGQRLEAVERRAKYLLFRFENGSLLVHLGMSGSLRIVAAGLAPENTTTWTSPSARGPCACATRGASGWYCGSPATRRIRCSPSWASSRCPTASTAAGCIRPVAGAGRQSSCS
jgi:hypothetical protein